LRKAKHILECKIDRIDREFGELKKRFENYLREDN